MSVPAVLVTGAAGGIGRAIALSAAARGWRVAAVDIDADGAERTAGLAGDAGSPQAIGIACDVTDSRSVEEAFDRAKYSIGLPRMVVANAGIEINAPLEDLTDQQWERVIGVNLTGVFLTVRAGIRMLRRQNETGSVVCTSSPSAFVGFAGGGNAAYGASKGGISAFVRSVAIDYARFGIRVNALVPGATDTPILLAGLTGEARTARAREISRDAAEQIPLGRLARTDEIAAAALWLLGDESSYVTGSNLVCDGGLLAKSPNTF